MPITPAATAPSPSRSRPRLKVATPNMTAKIPITIDQIDPARLDRRDADERGQDAERNAGVARDGGVAEPAG